MERILIASANYQSVRQASYQATFIGRCLTISHKCLPCLPSGRFNACVPGVIQGSGDAKGAVNVKGDWFDSSWNL